MTSLIDAEREVLSALLNDPDRISEARQLLTSAHFSGRIHQAIYQAMETMEEQRWPVDILTLRETLERDQERYGVHPKGWASELTSLVGLVTSSSHLLFHAEMLRNAGTMRALSNLGARAGELARETPATIPDQVAAAVDEVTELSLKLASTEVTSSMDTVKTLAYDLAPYWCGERPREEGLGLETGLIDLDATLDGLRRGSLYILAARPGVGKSTVAMQMAINLAKSGHPGAFFSLEMGREELMERIVVNILATASSRLRKGKLDHEETEKALATCAELPIMLIDKAGLTPSGLRSTLHQVKHRMGLEWIVVDYLQLMRVPQLAKQGRYEQVSAISAALKALAMDFKVPLIALSQLNRDAADTRPQLHHLRESGSIEQDADVVIMGWHDDKEKSAQGLSVVLNLGIEKNRQGPLDTIRLTQDKEYFRIRNHYPDMVPLGDSLITP